jgi:thiol:disulfide interchange protein DsbG
MRWKTAALVGLFASPAMAASPPSCAVAGTTTTAAEASSPAASQPAPMPPLPTPLPATLAQVPFAQHVAAAGAVVNDLGTSHQLHTLAAHSGDQFMLFEVAPDGEAAVSGVALDLTLAQLRAVAASNMTDLGQRHGLDGYFVRSGQQFQVFYASPDGDRVIPGVMWDAAGKDLTRDQVAQIPGAVPTVEAVSEPVGSGASPAALPLVQKASFGTIGPASAPHLYMLIDPQCVYSIRAFQMLRPYAEAGHLQLSVVPLSVLDYEDHGQSTKSALALLSDPVDQIVSAWQSGSMANTPSAGAAPLLAKNMAVAEAIKLTGTPTFVWRKPDGNEGRLDGLPTSVPDFIASIGSGTHAAERR